MTKEGVGRTTNNTDTQVSVHGRSHPHRHGNVPNRTSVRPRRSSLLLVLEASSYDPPPLRECRELGSSNLP